MLKRLMLSSLIVLSFTLIAQSTHAAAPPAQIPGDTDHDGKLSLDEAKAAADKKFDSLDADHEGTLSLREVRGVITPREFRAADGDHDKKLEKSEWETIVTTRFNAADAEHDGQVTPDELATPAGKKLAALLQ